MYLEIITPDEKVFEGEVDSVKMPGSMGAFQVLENHAALVSALGKGTVTVRGQEGQEIIIDEGVVEVLKNKVIILAESLVKE